MFKPVSCRTFDANDHLFFMPALRFANTKDEALKIRKEMRIYRETRRTIQAYLYAIQKRIDRGQNKAALQLFNRMVIVTKIPYWAVVAVKDELNKPNRS